jgi:fructosamine-3-kinase
MTVPDSVMRGVEALLEASSGRAARVTGARPVGGGCINAGARLATDRGDVLFLKWNARAPLEMFQAECDGLVALRASCRAHGLRVPEPLGAGGGRGEPSWLVMEYVEPGVAKRRWGEALGRGLAGLHAPAAEVDAACGWHRDNYIGSLRQSNPPISRWSDFWRDARLAPQIALAHEHQRVPKDDARLLERLVDCTGDALAGVNGGSLLHGDLWSGNAFPSAEGEPVLIDPAVCIGHREVDVAMSELFGGFPTGFLEAYHEAFPLDADYRHVRRPLYQLYYLLVHLNLFGGSYLGGVRNAAAKVLGAL